MNTTTDSNGKKLTANMRKENNGYSVNVWFGGYNGGATNVRRYTYRTRGFARNADISDKIGKNGRIA